MGKTVAFIPARAGSKSIPEKNIKSLAGKPLLYWTVEAALECPEIDLVYVSTDGLEIKASLEKLNHKKLAIIPRSAESASDSATTEQAMIEFANQFEFETIVLIQATSPLLKSKDITEGLAKLRNSQANSLLSVVKQKRFLWGNDDSYIKPLNYEPQNRPRRQEFDGFFVENGAFYITSKEALLASRCRLSGKIGFHEMDAASYIEIDEVEDWMAVEAIMKEKQKNCASRVPKGKPIRLVVTDVDGVLTDSGMYYSETGDELKKFNTRDGKGFALLRNAGIQTAIVTSEDTKIVERRAKKIKADFLYQGVTDKVSAIKELSKKLSISMEEIAMIGDDLNDKEALSIVGFSACPQDAVSEIRDTVDYICSTKGGKGCLREVCNLIRAESV